MFSNRPIIISFVLLSGALRPLHFNDPVWISRLHDIWKDGTPTPDSRILLPKGYDERKRQPGNVEKRIVPAKKLYLWIKELAAKRGISMTDFEADRLLRRIETAAKRANKISREYIMVTQGLSA